MYEKISHYIVRLQLASRAAGVLFACSLTLFFSWAPATNAQYTLEKLYVQGDAAPDSTSFYWFSAPGLTNSGEVFFGASVYNSPSGGTIDPDGGLWSGVPGDIHLIIKEGDAAPGIPGTELKYIHEASVNDVGTVGFRASFEDPTAPVSFNQYALWVGNPGGWNLLAAYGQQAPDTDPGCTWSHFARSTNLGADWLSETDEVAFIGHAWCTDPQPGYANGIWTGTAGGLQRIETTSQVTDPVMNAFGDFAYLKTNIPPGNGRYRDLLVYSEGVSQTVASVGQNAPDTSDATFLALLGPIRFSSGQDVSFVAQLNDSDEIYRNDRGLFVGPPDSLQLLVRGNDSAVGVPGATHQACCVPDVNDQGVAVFFDFIGGEGVNSTEGNNEGIWMGTPGNLQLVARAGDLVPGATGDVRFDRFYSPIINNVGEVAFLVKLTGEDVPNYGTFGTESLWVGTPGNLTMIAMEGDVVDVNGEDRPFKSIEFPAAGSSTASNTPKTRGLNDLGQITFRATFQGAGTTLDDPAIFLATPTAPPNEPPVAYPNGPYYVDEGTGATLDGTGSSDPDGDPLTYSWSVTGPATCDDLTSPTQTCTWPDNGSFDVCLTVDDGQYSDSACASVTVNNVAPTASFSAPSNVNEGSDIALSLTSPFDPSSADTTAGFQYAFDCGAGYGAFGSSSGASCPTTDNEVRTVGGKIRDKDGGESEYTASVTVVNLPPTVSLGPTSQIVQYSDEITQVSVTATDGPSDPLTATPSWSVNGGGFSAGLPANLSLTLDNCSVNGQTSCSWTISGTVAVPAGTYTVRITVQDDDGGQTTQDTVLTVEPENASVDFDSDNAVAIKVAAPGEDSRPFSLIVYVHETVPDTPAEAAHPGDISLAQVSMLLQPVGPGGTETGTCVPGAVTGNGYDAILAVTCNFNEVPVNTYAIDASVGGGYYVDTSEDVLTVYDPSLGFTTGGGWFYWPGSSDKTNFGYTMKYNKKATKVQGSLLLIRHLSDGSIYRVKSNALYGLALGEVIAPPYGWASFNGKATYLEPGWPAPEGNHEFVVYVEDRDEHGTGTDRVWIEVVDKDGNLEPLSMNRDYVLDNVVMELRVFFF